MSKIFITLFLLLSSQTVLAAADTMSCNSKQSSYNCLVCNCYHETRGEPTEGKIAVAKTVLSRAGSDSFPDSVCGVVYQPAQFSWTNDKYSNNISASQDADKAALDECRSVANLAIDEGGNGLIYFYNPRKAKPAWANKATLCGRAGEHVFLVPRGEKCPASLGANRRAGNGSRQQGSQQQGTRPNGATKSGGVAR